MTSASILATAGVWSGACTTIGGTLLARGYHVAGGFLTALGSTLMTAANLVVIRRDRNKTS